MNHHDSTIHGRDANGNLVGEETRAELARLIRKLEKAQAEIARLTAISEDWAAEWARLDKERAAAERVCCACQEQRGTLPSLVLAALEAWEGGA